MCGIFGIISSNVPIQSHELRQLAHMSERRGKDSSGLLWYQSEKYQVSKADNSISQLLQEILPISTSFAMGHTRLITNGQSDNQPVVKENFALLHNGIIVNPDDYWKSKKSERQLEIDSEALVDVAFSKSQSGEDISDISDFEDKLEGSFSCALLDKDQGNLYLMSNTGSLFFGSKDGKYYFASEKYFLRSLNVDSCEQILGLKKISVQNSNFEYKIKEIKKERPTLIPSPTMLKSEEKKLIYNLHKLKRCSKCILPETMPFIKFDEKGVCNYCKNYKQKNSVKPKEKLTKLLESYQPISQNKVLVPFSGGRDSSYSLHLLKTEFGMEPITMTYDWGMVTDLARRNIARMCSQLGVENIIIADNIRKKRDYVKRNLEVWLKKPHLGMLNILMAGDKHFFRHIQTIKRETNISLNIWGMNPLETTHFKAGFLGVPPSFEMSQVFNTGLKSQITYHSLRFKTMLKNPGYFNRSLWDTLSGEYYRSIKEQTDFYNLYDYWYWDEEQLNSALVNYDWERMDGVKTTWRIGDGTAAFYNYVYYTIAGFTEFDSFRSNQIREGQLTRSAALELIEDENRPQYGGIKWYLDTLEMNFSDVTKTLNEIPRLY